MVVGHQEAGFVWSVGYYKVIQSHSPVCACNLHRQCAWLVFLCGLSLVIGSKAPAANIPSQAPIKFWSVVSVSYSHVALEWCFLI